MQKHCQKRRARYPAYPSEKNAKNEHLDDKKPVILDMNHAKNSGGNDDDGPWTARRPQPASKQKSTEQGFFPDRNEDDDGDEEQRQQVRASCRLVNFTLEPVDDVASCEPADGVARSD